MKNFITAIVCILVSVLSLTASNVIPLHAQQWSRPSSSTDNVGSITITNTQFSIVGITPQNGALPVLISAISANSTGTASQVSVTSANGVQADVSDTTRKTILACNKDSVYNVAIGLTSPVTASTHPVRSTALLTCSRSR